MIRQLSIKWIGQTAGYNRISQIRLELLSVYLLLMCVLSEKLIQLFLGTIL